MSAPCAGSWRGHGRALLQALALQCRSAPAGSALATALTILSSSVPAAAAYLLKRFVDELAGAGADRALVVTLAVAAGAIAGLSVVVHCARTYLDTVVRRRMAAAVDHALLSSIARLPGLRRFEDPMFQGQLRAAERAATEAPLQFSELAQSILRTTVTVAGLVGVVLSVSPLLGLLILLAGASGLGAQLVRSRTELRMMERLVNSSRWRDFHRSLPPGLDDLQLARAIGAMVEANAQESAIERRTLILQGGLFALTAVIAAVGAFVAVDGVMVGRLQAGDVVLFIAAVGGVQGVFGHLVLAIGIAGRTLLMFRSYVDALERPGAEPQPGARAAPAPMRRGVELRDVWFRYRADDPWILRGVDLVIPHGRAIGLVGTGGAGKSTLVKLLCRFYDAERGQILWDGVDVRELDPVGLRRRIGATFQEFMSCDEWQRVALARALVGADVNLLILDEPRSAPDPAAYRIQQTLHRHGKGPAQLLISHSPSALRGASVIAVLSAGRIVELGTHGALMAAGGEYARLFALQARCNRDDRFGPEREVIA